jgi:hypothetical protein
LVHIKVYRRKEQMNPFYFPDEFAAIILPGDTKCREYTQKGVWEHQNTAPCPGIWVFHRVGTSVQPLRLADQTERTKLFDALELQQITVLPVQKTSQWLVMAANSNSWERSVKVKVPLPLMFAPETISIFDPVVARVYRQRRVWLLYEDLNERYPVKDVERARSLFEQGMKTGLKSMTVAMSGLQTELAAALGFALETAERPIESICKYALKLAGATLKEVTELGNGRDRVNYSFKEYEDSVVINDTLTVLNSGICLDGHDQDFDLTAIVFVKDKKHEMNEYDD